MMKHILLMSVALIHSLVSGADSDLGTVVDPPPMPDLKDDPNITHKEKVRPGSSYSMFDWGQSFWIEMVGGAGMALPFSWLRFYMPEPCTRHSLQMTNDLAEMTFHWNELTQLEEGWVIFDENDNELASQTTINKNIYYLLVNNASLLITMP